MNASSGYIGIAEVARKLGVSQMSVRRLTASEKLPYTRISGSRGHRRFKIEDIDRFLAIRTADAYDAFISALALERRERLTAKKPKKKMRKRKWQNYRK